VFDGIIINGDGVRRTNANDGWWLLQMLQKGNIC